jgi:predicted amino acid racemase
VAREPWPGTAQDVFALHAEVVELQCKPSLPEGARTADAFGRRRDFEDRGLRARALLDVGREDVDVAGLTPLDPRVKVLGASSDYLVLDVTDAGSDVRVGDELSFGLSYGALLAAMDSEYVEKRYRGDA